MSKYFQKKVIWLTGASSGIGEALAYEFARMGAKIILSARRKEELDRVRGNCIPQTHANIRVLPLDLALPETLKLSTEAAIQLFGHIDILINNGGISQRSLAKNTSLEVDRQIMEVDYFGSIALTKYLLPHFLKRKSGHYVTVTSVNGKLGISRRTSYAAAKHALHGFFDSLRAELWKESKNIYVTLICPGWINTNLSIAALTGDGKPQNRKDETHKKGMKPLTFAKKMIRAVEKKKREVYIGGAKEGFAIFMSRNFPGLFSKIIRNIKVK
ncbi:MAG: SDR family oxidoreductase [Bacteroidia bacterium]|nr:SDR family oxidoreductase [Bacteroidia bacterium]